MIEMELFWKLFSVKNVTFFATAEEYVTDI